MDNHKDKKTLREEILDKIKNGTARMRPKRYFILRALLAAFGLFILAAGLLYLSSLTLFILHQSGVWFLPGFGLAGLGVFLMSLPWLLILSALAFLLLLEILVQHYSFAHQKPLLYSLLGIILFTAFAGFFLSRTRLHEEFFRQAWRGRLPLAGKLYRGYGLHRNKNIHIGAITRVNDKGFEIESREGETLIVEIASATRISLGNGLREGERVLIFGERKGNIIKALGIRDVRNDIRPFFRDRDRLNE